MPENIIEKLVEIKCLIGVATVAAGNKEALIDHEDLECLLCKIYSDLEDCIGLSCD